MRFAHGLLSKADNAQIDLFRELVFRFGAWEVKPISKREIQRRRDWLTGASRTRIRSERPAPRREQVVAIQRCYRE
jgi:hypothetical protein